MTDLPRKPSIRPQVVASLALAALLIVGCDRAVAVLASAQPPTGPDQTGPAIQLGGGTAPSGPWTGWLYPTATGACIDIVVGDRPGDPICQGGSEPFTGDIGVGVNRGDGVALVYGSTIRQDAATAAISTRNGEVVRVPIVRPAGAVANGNGYFMTRFEPDRDVDLILVLDANDRELDRYPIGR